MPTYEYVCSKCDHHFEKYQSITEEPLAVCPKELCGRSTWGKGKVKRMIGAWAGLLFKGSGFYITDYRSESYKEAAKKEPSTPSPSAAGETKSSSGTRGDQAKPSPKSESSKKSGPASDAKKG